MIDKAKNIPDGYKNTELGVIPEDWDLVRIGDVFFFKNGLNKEKSFFGEGTPIVNYMDVYLSVGLKANDLSGKVTLSFQEIKNYEVKKGDVFFTRTSETINEIGSTSVVLEELVDTVFSGFLLRARPFKYAFENEYCQYCFFSSKTRRQIIATASYTTRALTNGRLLSNVKIPVPPLPEQKAIAEILGDTDELIRSLDALIEKKKNVKQGMMQELLTGKRRLPGYGGKNTGYKNTELGVIPEDWDVKTLGEIADCIDNLRIPLNENQRNIMQGDIPYCGANGILDYINDFIFDDDLILLAEDGGYFDDYLKRPIAYRMIGKCWVNNHAHILKAKNETDQGFLFYSLVHKNILNYISSGTRSKLNRAEMNKIEINCPPIPEQQSIAEVLSDMDAEIKALEQKRDKVKLVKLGMMQELLTGRIRLV